MSIESLRQEILTGTKKQYAEKYIHNIPSADVVDRVKFIVDKCRGKIVVDIGCKGPLHKIIMEVASKTYGMDKNNEGIEHFPNLIIVDLDYLRKSAFYLPPDREIIICGEVLEHLANPGIFLEELQIANCPIIFTVPNAYTDIGMRYMEKGAENVNKDHVAYYSYYTFKTLVERYGYEIQEWKWYNGRPRFAEGLIFVVQYKGL